MSSRIEVTTTIARLETQVEKMQNQENELLTQLGLLRSSMQEFKAQIFKLSSLCAPIGSLPIEILLAIFNAGPSRSWDYKDVREHLYYVLCISQVSRHWRGIALANPSLWTSIYVCVCNSDPHMGLMNLFIERSCMHPLDITIDTTNPSVEYDSFLDRLTPQLDVLLPLTSRWRSVLVSASIWTDVYNVCASFEELCVPRLVAFEVLVNSDQDREEYEDKPLLVFQGGAPKLTHVKVFGVPLTFCKPPLSTLSLLHLHTPPERHQYRDVLTASSHLTDLRLYGNIMDGDEIFPDLEPGPELLTIELPSLLSLTVSPPSSKALELFCLLANLQTPSLESLTVHCCIFVPNLIQLQSVFHRINGSSRYPHLRSLSLHWADFTECEVVWIVTMLPAITHLELRLCRSPGKLLGVLLLSQSQLGEEEGHKKSELWPLLRVITLSSFLYSEDVDVLCNVVSNRISCGIPIECVQLDSFDAAIPSERMQWLRKRIRVEKQAN